MIDILFSNDINQTTGPTKVVRNLIKGLEKMGVEYTLNRKIPHQPLVFIPNGRSNLFKLALVRESQKIAIGPNLFILPEEIPMYLKPFIRRSGIYLHPSTWVVEVWDRLHYNLTPLCIWPVGIDTDQFVPTSKVAVNQVLIYHKERSKAELSDIEQLLQRKKISFKTIYYGNYKESDYLQLLNETSLVIWHACYESQGIALLEALAANIPILVCDVNSFSKIPNFPQFAHSKHLDPIRVTSAPYFDGCCGIKIESLSMLPAALTQMQDSLHDYQPREYILEHFRLEKQAKQLLTIIANSY